MVSVKQVYTSVACNRLPEIVDWNKDGLMCFGASNAVVIYDTVHYCNLFILFLYFSINKLKAALTQL